MLPEFDNGLDWGGCEQAGIKYEKMKVLLVSGKLDPEIHTQPVLETFVSLWQTMLFIVYKYPLILQYA